MRVPTVISPSASAGSMARAAAISISPIIAGVESTDGSRGLWYAIVYSLGTSFSSVCSRPSGREAGSVGNGRLLSHRESARHRAQIPRRRRRTEEAAEDLSQRQPQLSPQPALQRAVVLRA